MAALAAGCGGSDAERSACDVVPLDRAAAIVRAAATDARVPERAVPQDSYQLSACRYEGSGTNIRLTVDSAPQARLRYFNRLTEQQQFGARRFEQNPQLIRGVADDTAVGGAGAYWIPGRSQLVAVDGKRLLILTLSLPGAGAREERAVALRLLGDVVGRAGPGGAEDAAEDEPSVVLADPTDGARLRSARVVVRGAVTPPGRRVLVNGRPARVRGTIFERAVALRAGENTIRVESRRGAKREASATATVTRAASPAAEAARLRARRAGVVPDLAGERVGAARAILRDLGWRARARIVDPAYRGETVSDLDWVVCFTRPRDGARPPRSRRIVLVVDRLVGRRSGPACDFF